jgi:hypothetical protein
LSIVAGVIAVAAIPALASGASAPTRASNRALRTSHELWATVDVCSPKDQPNTVGIRGSMPADGKAADKMYMSFRLQVMSAAKQWVDLSAATSPNYVAVGSSATARQGGRSFQLVPVAGMPAAQLRGVVDFQWRHGKTVLFKVSRPTTAGHPALAGADPSGFSAASCLIG